VKNIVRLRLLHCAALVLLAFTALVGRAAEAPAGRLEKIVVHGRSLEGNLAGDSADRTVYVYLPPGYAADTRARFPVLYYLHGFGVPADRYVSLLQWPQSIDRAIASGKLPELIVVMPDAFTVYGGSMYSNSITTGDWEAFVARDLTAHVDANYRTVARREARGLAGHSMGGYGTLRIGMKYPGTFLSLYAMSACCLDPRGVTPQDPAIEKLTRAEEIAALPPFGRTTFASSAAWAGNAARPPFFLDLPTQDGQPQADVLARYTQGQNFRLAIAAPSASAASFAQTTSGSTPPEPTWMLKPQSTAAITLSRPTRFA
jgi:pimeloyl-ACP methyl ester carboxylesterase